MPHAVQMGKPLLTRLIPPPEMVSLPAGAETTILTATDGMTLRAAFWPAHPNAPSGTCPAGTVFLLQGRTEFMEKYADIIASLQERGLSVATLDWRGQGGSPRLLRNRNKGHIEDFDDYLLDLDALTAEAHHRQLPQPFHILAHSMGGAIALMALARGPSPFTRAVLCAPLVKIARLPSQTGARLIARVLASLGLSSAYVPFGGPMFIGEKPFEGNQLTSDPRQYAKMQAWTTAEPALAIGDPTIGWVDAAFNALSTFEHPDFGARNRTPILMVLAGKDEIVETRAAEALGHRMRSASTITIPGARHEILIENEEIRAQFWQAFDAFIPTPRRDQQAL